MPLYPLAILEANRLTLDFHLQRPLYQLHARADQQEDAEALAGDLDIALPRMLNLLGQTTVPEPVRLYLPAALRSEETAPLHLVLRAFADHLLTRRSDAKPGGWRLPEAPAWFRQGYLDYLALSTLEPDVRDAVIADCRDVVRAQPDMLEADAQGIRVGDDLIGGLVLLAFFHDHWGRWAGLALLDSTAPTLTAAMEAVFGLTPPQVLEVCFSYLLSPHHEH